MLKFKKKTKKTKQKNRKLTLICFSGRLPVFSTNDRQTNLTFLINVWMIDFCPEVNLWRFKGIFSWIIYFNTECSFIVRWILLEPTKLCQSRFFLSDINLVPHEKCKLTGTMTPCHRSMFDSSTWTSLNALRPEARMSASSCNQEKRTHVNHNENARTKTKFTQAIHCNFNISRMKATERCLYTIPIFIIFLFKKKSTHPSHHQCMNGTNYCVNILNNTIGRNSYDKKQPETFRSRL